MAPYILLLACLCKENDAILFDGIFSVSSWTLVFTGLSLFKTFTYHSCAPSKKLYSFFWHTVHHLTEFYSYPDVRDRPLMWYHLLLTPV